MSTTETDQQVVVMQPGDLISLLFAHDGQPSQLLITRDDVVLIDLNRVRTSTWAPEELPKSRSHFQQLCSCLAALCGLGVDEATCDRRGRSCVVVCH